MNHVIIIGNLTADPETRTTQDGKMVVSFTVAVNRRGNQQGADYFRVSAWNKLGELCKAYLAKGRKVSVTGSIRAGAYQNSEGKAVGTLELKADDVEFLSPREQQQAGFAPPVSAPPPVPGGFVKVEDEELPF